jgi:hypothetical protein
MPLARGGLAWNRAGAGFRFTYAGRTGRTTGRTFSYDGVNVITATDKGPAGGTLATNYYWYRPDTGELLDSDIEFNSYYAWSLSGQAGRFDVQSVACHELGHSLVLLDLYSSADSEKTMYGYAAPGETKKRTLHQDDIEGIRSIYP